MEIKMLTDCKQPLLQLQPRQLPKILISSTTFKPSLSRTYRPISLRCESQILKPLTSVLSKQGEIFSSTSTIWSNQMEFFKAASTVIGVFGPVFSVVSALYSLAVVYKGGDLIELPINGVVTIGYVHSIGVFNTNVQLQSGGGWYKIKHFNGDIKTVCNLTRVDGALKFYRIYVDFEIDKNSPLKEIKQKIKDIISKEEYVQDLSVSLLTEKKIGVSCYIPLSKLKTPRFESYLEIRDDIISAVGGSFRSSSPPSEFFKFLKIS